MKRLMYLDVLRGIAILLMVVDHSYDWWVNAAGQAAAMRTITSFLGTLAAPLFLFLVGCSLALSRMKQVQSGIPRSKIYGRMFWRGVFLFLAGYFVNLLVYFTGDNPADIFAIDILQIIGLSIVVAIPFIELPLFWTAVLFMPVFIIGQSAGDWDLPAWLAQMISGSIGISYFPLALWFPYVLAGMIYGRMISEEQAAKMVNVVAVIIGLLLFLILPHMHAIPGFRHPFPIFVCFSMALILWSAALSWFLVERKNALPGLSQVLGGLGKTSLLLYVYHLVVGYRIFWLIGWVTGRSWRGDFGVFAPWSVYLLLSLFTLSMVFVSRWWLAEGLEFYRATLQRILRGGAVL